MTTHRPYTLIAELTYRCPLGCPYCSNPTDDREREELACSDWQRVFAQAAKLGVVQLHLSGGEPLLRHDLLDLVTSARANDLYVNLISSGIPLTKARLTSLKEAGLDHFQLSLQDSDSVGADRIAHHRAFDAKLEVAHWIKEAGLAFTLNVVLHRENLDHVEAIIALAERLAPDRLELANTQYHGWAFKNRDQLLPTRAQIDHAYEIAMAARERLRGQMEIVFVKPDYFSDLPKACMDGWAHRFLHIAPTGLALPCHAAHTIAGLNFENVRDRSLDELWNDSPGFQKFRGDDWMADPCRSCERRHIDYGGCRCQAFHLTGNASATDPACSLSPDHALIAAARDRASVHSSTAKPPLTYRIGRSAPAKP